MIGPFLFLDIDGVLNKHDPHPNGYCGTDPDCVAVLNAVLEETGAKVIMSSAWRYYVLRGEMNLAGLQGLLCTHGLKWGVLVDVLGPDIPDGVGGADRGLAVKNWFGARYGIAHSCRYLAVDDMDLGYTKHGIPFVKTDPGSGLAGLPRGGIDWMISHLKGEAGGRH